MLPGEATMTPNDPAPAPDDAAPPDAAQVRAIEHLDGGLLLLAPVGTGKTRTLAARVVRAVRAGIAPDRVLCVTFTNRAAEEMRARVRRALPDEARRVHVATFHGWCARFLQLEHRRLGLPPDFSIVDEGDQDELLREAGAPDAPKDRRALLDALHAAKSPVGTLDRDDVRLQPSAGPETLFADVPPAGRAVLARYQRLLADRQSLDFDDLVRWTRGLLRADAALAAAWGARYDLVQVDEVQDAHESEYEVVRALARGSRRLALIGDVDQTIYGWRGSAPRRVLEAFRRDFAPVTSVTLRWNHRATKTLVRVADAVLTGLPERRTRVVPAPHLPEGEPVRLHAAQDPADEAAWVARRVREVGAAGTPWSRIGVLARTNEGTRRLGAALARERVPHVTVEEFDFFRRQEVKDAVALLRLVLRPDDGAAAQRALLRPARGLGDVGLGRLRTEGGPAGLRVADLVGPAATRREDPFAAAVDGAARGPLVVLDVETTGLDPELDEVIEVGAVRLEGGRETATYHALVRPTRAVGESVHTHGLTDELLAREGRPARDVLAELASFVGAAPAVGHNVEFDAAFLEANAARAGAALRLPARIDTLVLSRRFLDLPRYDLATVLTHLGGTMGTAHRALDDARAAAEVLRRLAPAVAAGRTDRTRLMGRLPDGVVALAALLADLRARSRGVRPAALLREALVGSRLAAHYAKEPVRRANLDDLVGVLERQDDPAASATQALRDAVRFASLAKNLAMEALVDGRVPVVTVHQAKGLEFDVVFVAGAVDDEFPSWFAKQDGGERLAEEQRLFYVAVTRARRALFLSTHAVGDRGHRRVRTPYLAAVAPGDLQAT